MYPQVPPSPYGRASLEWYQISHMRHRNPQMMTYGEMENVWDKLNDPQLDHFLSRHDFQAILTALQDNIRAKGAGKSNCNLRTTAWPMSQNTWAETLAEIDHLADEVVSPPREELHAYLAPGKGDGKEKGKGKSSKPKPFPRQRSGEPWSRRTRMNQMQTVSEQDSTDPSMPDLLEDEDNDDNADVRDVTIERTADGREIVHA